MSAHNLMTLFTRTSLNVYDATIFNCSRQAPLMYTIKRFDPLPTRILSGSHGHPFSCRVGKANAGEQRRVPLLSPICGCLPSIKESERPLGALCLAAATTLLFF